MLSPPKKLKQFADLEEGDTYARINIKDYGTITVKFFQEEAPLAVENFIAHAKDGYYDGVTFHRVIDDFMIQGGDQYRPRSRSGCRPGTPRPARQESDLGYRSRPWAQSPEPPQGSSRRPRSH